MSSALIDVAKGLDSGLTGGPTTTINLGTGNAIITVNPFTFGITSQTIGTTAAAFTVAVMALSLYQSYDAKDDHKIFESPHG